MTLASEATQMACTTKYYAYAALLDVFGVPRLCKNSNCEPNEEGKAEF